MSKVPLSSDPNRAVVRATDLRAFVQRNRHAADAVAASNLPPAAKAALTESFLEIRQLARVVAFLARATNIEPGTMPDTES